MGRSKRQAGKAAEKPRRRRNSKADVEQMLQNLFMGNPQTTFKLKDIFRELRLNTHPLKMLALSVLDEMTWDDFLKKEGDNAFRLNMGGQVQEGRFVRKLNGKNSIVPDGTDKPIFVSERNSLWAQNGDRVRFSLMARRRNHIREAQVLEILQRAKDTFVGTLRVDSDIAFLVTQDNLIVQDILIPKSKLMGGKSDDKALVRITQWPDAQHRNMVGEVIDILGQQGENNAEMHAILAQYGLPYRYPKEVEEAANKISGKVTEKDLAEREDFRDVWTCTIDPHDAKDFDDALSIRKIHSSLHTSHSSLYEVGVHIADVWSEE